MASTGDGNPQAPKNDNNVDATKMMLSLGLRTAIMDGDENLVETLLQRGADLNHQGEYDGASPLIMAAGQERVEIVRRLLSAGAHPWLRDKKNQYTALDYASVGGRDRDVTRDARLAIIRAIATHPTCDIDSEGPLGTRPTGGGTALFKATRVGEVESVRLLLSLGARTDIPCAGRLPREVAAEKGYGEIMRLFDNPPALICDRRPGHNILKLRMEDSADGYRGEMLTAMKTPASDRTQRQVDVLMTMAMTAAIQNKVDQLEFLLTKNSDLSYRAVNLRSADFAEGFTLLHDAAGSEIPNVGVVRLLLRHGADPNIRSKRGHTPLDVAEGKCQDLYRGTNQANVKLLRRHMKKEKVILADKEFDAGAAVMVHGLKKYVDLNGKRGRVVSGPGPDGRWEVRLDGQQGNKTIGIQPANLQLVPEEKVRRDAVGMADGLSETLQATMLESLLKGQRTGNYEADAPMEEAARLIMGTMGQAMRDGDHETMRTMLSDNTHAKVDTIMNMRDGNHTRAPVKWAPQEEERLKAAAAKFRRGMEGRWEKVAEQVGGGRTATECKKHHKALGH